MDETTLEFVKIFADFLQNLIILGVGYIIARFTVNHYQKTKDANAIREKLIDLHSDAIMKFELFRLKIDELNKFLPEIIEEMKSTQDIDKLKEPLNNINSSEFMIGLKELEVAINTLSLRLQLQLELTLEDIIKIGELKKSLLSFINYWNKVIPYFQPHQFSILLERKNLRISKKEHKIQNESFTVILNSFYTVSKIIITREVRLQKINTKYSIP